MQNRANSGAQLGILHSFRSSAWPDSFPLATWWLRSQQVKSGLTTGKPQMESSWLLFRFSLTLGKSLNFLFYFPICRMGWVITPAPPKIASVLPGRIRSCLHWVLLSSEESPYKTKGWNSLWGRMRSKPGAMSSGSFLLHRERLLLYTLITFLP